MKTFEILTNSISTVTTQSYTLQDEAGNVYHYIEYLNDKGKLIDEELRSESGFSIQDDPSLLEDIQNFVDSIS